MNDTVTIDRVVAAFVERVRHHLRDLGDDEQQELTEGLEADLTDLVAERGPDALGDPGAYAGELRSAAGLEGQRRQRLPRPSAAGITDVLDRAHERWDRLVAVVPGGTAEILETLRPVWWVIRAWVAVELAVRWFGSYPFEWIPRVFGFGWLVLLVAVVLSVQLGRGVLALGPLHGLPRRLVLLALNAFAVVMVLPVVTGLPTGHETTNEGLSYVVPHLAFNGNQIVNVYPYDAQGRPLTGVQLVDQDGQRLSVVGSHCFSYWTNGNKRVYSAFPVPSRTIDPSDSTCHGSTTLTFPLASLPPVSLPADVAAATGQTPAP